MECLLKERRNKMFSTPTAPVINSPLGQDIIYDYLGYFFV